MVLYLKDAIDKNDRQITSTPPTSLSPLVFALIIFVIATALVVGIILILTAIILMVAFVLIYWLYQILFWLLGDAADLVAILAWCRGFWDFEIEDGAVDVKGNPHRI